MFYKCQLCQLGWECSSNLLYSYSFPIYLFFFFFLVIEGGVMKSLTMMIDLPVSPFCYINFRFVYFETVIRYINF